MRDLEGFSRLWLVWWFHKNRSWRPTTLPPRGRCGRKGTFATRSPYRPNPLGLSSVQLLAVAPLKLFIGPHDLLDGTPILDLKPYLPQFDSFPEESTGWLQEMEDRLEVGSQYRVVFELERSETIPVKLKNRVEGLLRADPLPHRTRRIISYRDGFRLSCGDWRVYYRVEGDLVVVTQMCLRENSTSLMSFDDIDRPSKSTPTPSHRPPGK